jgi:DNA-directed RNA polymerase specialized sigma24 family protein
MEINYIKLESYVRGALKNRRDMEDFEDAVQEGLIRGWKDSEEGSRDEAWIFHRAAMWASQHLTNDTHLPTGHMGRERDGITRASGNATREKIKMYVEQFTELHDRAPNQTEIANAIGLNPSTVHTHLQRMKTGNATVLYRTEGEKKRLDRSSYLHTPLLVDDRDGNSVRVHPEAESHNPAPSTEMLLLEELHFQALLAPLTKRSQEVLTLTHLYGWSQKEIGQYFGYTSPQAQARKLLLHAHKEVEFHFFGGEDPYVVKTGGKPRTSHCSRGHEWNEANTGFRDKTKKHRYCKPCNRIRNNKYDRKK